MRAIILVFYTAQAFPPVTSSGCKKSEMKVMQTDILDIIVAKKHLRRNCSNGKKSLFSDWYWNVKLFREVKLNDYSFIFKKKFLSFKQFNF